MQAVTLFASEANLLPEFRKRLEVTFPFASFYDLSDRQDPSQQGVCIEFTPLNSRIWVRYEGTDLLDGCISEYEELALILSYFPTEPHIYTLSFHDINRVKQAIRSIAATDQILVSDDCDYLVPGTEFVSRINREPDWNWLADYSNSRADEN